MYYGHVLNQCRSGKTYRAQQIAEYISWRIQDEPPSKRSVLVVESHHAGQDKLFDSGESVPSTLRDDVYTAASREKIARAEEFSATKRGMSRDAVVIADCPNYIKGYRYQLWCEAKAASTRCCVVHVAALEDDCRRWNEGRLKAWSREDEIEKVADSTPRDITTHGKDVLGDLQPESHTAVYGDRAVDQASHSRSSSMDGAADAPAQQQDDTMTLKSLYISAPTAPSPKSTDGTITTVPLAESKTTLPSTPIPPPPASPPYAPSTLTSLLMRYEPPSPFSRWDTPLFTVPTSDTHPPYAQIWEAIFPPAFKPTSRKALSQLPHATSTSEDSPSASATSVRPHAATVLPTATATSALQTLESCTLLVVRALLTAARAHNAADGDGGVVSFAVPSPTTNTATPASPADDGGEQPDEQTYSLTIPPGTVLSQPMLQRLRRQYTAVQRGRIAHGQGYVGQQGRTAEAVRKEVVGGFVRFLEGELGEGDD